MYINRDVVHRYTRDPFYGTREKLPNKTFGKYIWKSYAEVYKIVTSLAKSFEELDLCPTIIENGRKIRPLGILCRTREEWVYNWFATWYINGCVVPLYDTLGTTSNAWIINQCELKTVVTTPDLIKKLIALKKEEKVKNLVNVITIEPLTEDVKNECDLCGLKVYNYKDCIEIGNNSKIKLNPIVKPDNLATICYTSGTTSNPKGVILVNYADGKQLYMPNYRINCSETYRSKTW